MVKKTTMMKIMMQGICDGGNMTLAATFVVDDDKIWIALSAVSLMPILLTTKMIAWTAIVAVMDMEVVEGDGGIIRRGVLPMILVSGS